MWDSTLYDLTQQIQGSIFQAAFQAYQHSLSEKEATQPPTPPLLMQLRRGYAESPGWMLVQMFEFDPEALTVEKFRRRAVYSAPKLSEAILEFMVSARWIDRNGEQYVLTEHGRSLWEESNQRRKKILANFDAVPQDEMEHMAKLMQRIIDASMVHTTIPSVWCLYHSRRRAIWYDNDPTEQIIQLCSDFNAFRDDAHMSAYAPYNITGHVWEALSHVCNGLASSATDLFDKLHYRGYTINEWQQALDELEKRGWITLTFDGYEITDSGKSVHDDVEQKTDAYFFAPWSCLNDTEQKQLHRQMKTVISAVNN